MKILRKIYYKSKEGSYVPDKQYCHRLVEEVRNPKTDDGHACLLGLGELPL